MRRAPALGRILVLLGLACAVVATACTAAEQMPRAAPTSRGSPTAPASSSAPIVVPVIGDLDPQEGTVHLGNSYVDGMRLAERDVNRSGGVAGRSIHLELRDDDGNGGTARTLISDALRLHAPAILYAGPGEALTELRPEIERAGTPVFLVGGDLYSARRLYREVFQTTIPFEWQAHVIAKYVVRDRGASDVVFLGRGDDAELAADATRVALTYWGGRLAAAFTDSSASASTGIARPLARAANADWVIAYDAAPWAEDLVSALEEDADLSRARDPRDRPGVTGFSTLFARNRAVAVSEPGTSACSTYTWAGWAEPIARVRAFRDRFARMFGRLPNGLEQEGYDAVRTLVTGLRETGGSGGAALTAALERVHGFAPSGFPIDLGPDDHVLPPRDELGLFAIAGPEEHLDPWMRPGRDVWRPVMRTFTYDGERTNVLDRDKRVFFPFWRDARPAPSFSESRYGITTRASADPLH